MAIWNGRLGAGVPQQIQATAMQAAAGDQKME